MDNQYSIIIKEITLNSYQSFIFAHMIREGGGHLSLSLEARIQRELLLLSDNYYDYIWGNPGKMLLAIAM